MATTEQEVAAPGRNRVAWVALGATAVGLVVLAVVFLRSPPQLAPDEDVFKTVDALYTAVRRHDAEGLARCEQRLHAYREAGKLPADAADHLDGVIGKAKGGRWESAAERLYEFMLAQRREGPADAPKKEHSTPGKSARK